MICYDTYKIKIYFNDAQIKKSNLNIKTAIDASLILINFLLSKKY